MKSASQLVVFMHLLNAFSIDPSRASIYDPAFTLLDKHFLGSLGLHIPSSAKDISATLRLEEPTVVFLPYLPYPAIEQLFALNWDRATLSNLIIVGPKYEGWLDDE